MARLLRQRFSLGLGTEEDHDEAEEIDQADDAAHLRVVLVEFQEQGAADQGAAGGEDAAEVEAEAGACGADAGGEELRQIERQPAVERARDAVGERDEDEELDVE